MICRSLLLLSLFLAHSRTPAPAEEDPEKLAFTTLEGETISPLSTETDQPIAILFITVDCPIANAYAPEIGRIFEEYRPRGIRFLLIHVDPDLKVETARKHASDYNLKAPIVIDRQHQLVTATEATITPEAVVLDATGKKIYQGRIDDLFTDFGTRRTQASQRDLRNALEAVVEGKPVPVPETEAIGCLMPLL